MNLCGKPTLFCIITTEKDCHGKKLNKRLHRIGTERVKEGIAGPGAILLNRVSYGVYNITLMGLGKRPDRSNGQIPWYGVIRRNRCTATTPTLNSNSVGRW